MVPGSTEKINRANAILDQLLDDLMVTLIDARRIQTKLDQLRRMFIDLEEDLDPIKPGLRIVHHPPGEREPSGD